MKDLLKLVNTILKTKNSLPTLPGKNFNVFSVVDIETKEVSTHCRLLFELLNKNGSHGMGDVFLQEFFHLVLHKSIPKDVVVYREYVIDQFNSEEYGRIDLLIEGLGVCYPIEVKIYAGDQYRQIERYARYASKAKEQQVYYLSLDGHEPSVESTGNRTNVVCLSFAADIRTWLIRCGEIAWQAPSVAEIIRQYICLIDKLTGITQEDSFMEMIEKTVGASKESYESAMAIEQALQNVRVEMMQRVFQEIEAHIGNRLELFAPQRNYQNDATAFYTARKRVWPGLSYLITRLGDYSIALRFEVETNLYYGLVFFKNSWDQVPQERRKIADAFSSEEWEKIVSSGKSADWWLWWRYLPSKDNMLNFWNCNGYYMDLYDEDRHDEIMLNVFSEIDNNLDSILHTGVCANAVNSKQTHI